MKHYIAITVFFVAPLLCQSQNQEAGTTTPMFEQIIKNYFDGWVRKDWNLVSSQLDAGFTFTSAAPDDHISVDKFKEKCWGQAAFIQRFELKKIIAGKDDAFAIVHVVTNDGNVIRNVEYFAFSNGKIRSIEVFFGGSGQGFPTNVKP